MQTCPYCGEPVDPQDDLCGCELQEAWLTVLAYVLDEVQRNGHLDTPLWDSVEHVQNRVASAQPPLPDDARATADYIRDNPDGEDSVDSLVRYLDGLAAQHRRR